MYWSIPWLDGLVVVFVVFKISHLEKWYQPVCWCLMSTEVPIMGPAVASHKLPIRGLKWKGIFWSIDMWKLSMIYPVTLAKQHENPWAFMVFHCLRLLWRKGCWWDPLVSVYYLPLVIGSVLHRQSRRTFICHMSQSNCGTPWNCCFSMKKTCRDWLESNESLSPISKSTESSLVTCLIYLCQGST